ncbi:MAG: S-methyl-5-thioribose-1-phosphate isomerase [Candidatus Methanomethylophilaceae archaeon]|jgi:methylthioribose-1-phosphate isomerase|nr:methylthioribose-1-phosphate isomerase [Methanomassiliicoccales archaeon RumEn M2]MDD2532630.1 S-methyl-5-thioribose-1-phosphate isomerase [Candidatus Methanomethylophilaceae archaeon]MDI9378135.1 S-methyl-5-thioribose-1-phosphate isomerase [Candidatus Thermoplasmatota archaeon]MDD2778739.1 S-methyl-5-thioribose-1-phosphate isomerase [Candidatus Methanomethylophilaceae archaeon]MDD3128633.1 S-methyl-5-thioribose-1-phosphate isomerase [Candidatus Methanomethylophilaceae archaeon]
MKAKTEGGVRDIKAVWFEEGRVIMIDQRKLPRQLEFVSFDNYRDVAESISNMTTRGAPSIGATAAYGMCLAALKGDDIEKAAAFIKAARPTAYDLFYAVDHMADALRGGADPVEAADAYAQTIIDKCLAIGRHGEPLIKDGAKVMTHCNAGALATVDVGTALAPMRAAHEKGKRFFVYVSETRPRLQGMQLTSWELLQEDIDHAIIPDGASGHFLRDGVDLVILGADRIAANGDFANKIGTFEKAVLAKELGVPFYVAAPISTFDFSTRRGEDIKIEYRSQEEITVVSGVRIAPEGARALNPSFDMTPAKYVTGFITERGILKPNEIRKVLG